MSRDFNLAAIALSKGYQFAIKEYHKEQERIEQNRIDKMKNPQRCYNNNNLGDIKVNINPINYYDKMELERLKLDEENNPWYRQSQQKIGKLK